MLRRLLFPLWVGVVVLVLGGCSELTAPRLLTDFTWGEVEEPEAVVAGISTSVALGDLFILGQFTTPKRCFNIDAEFQRNEANLTVRVRARQTNAANCDERLGGFRYTATMMNLKFGTYDLRVIHDVTGSPEVEYTKTVTIR